MIVKWKFGENNFSCLFVGKCITASKCYGFGGSDLAADNYLHDYENDIMK